jgi:hypothetical protein
MDLVLQFTGQRHQRAVYGVIHSRNMPLRIWSMDSSTLDRCCNSQRVKLRAKASNTTGMTKNAAHCAWSPSRQSQQTFFDITPSQPQSPNSESAHQNSWIKAGIPPSRTCPYLLQACVSIHVVQEPGAKARRSTKNNAG